MTAAFIGGGPGAAGPTHPATLACPTLLHRRSSAGETRQAPGGTSTAPAAGETAAAITGAAAVAALPAYMRRPSRGPPLHRDGEAASRGRASSGEG